MISLVSVLLLLSWTLSFCQANECDLKPIVCNVQYGDNIDNLACPADISMVVATAGQAVTNLAIVNGCVAGSAMSPFPTSDDDVEDEDDEEEEDEDDDDRRLRQCDPRCSNPAYYNRNARCIVLWCGNRRRRNLATNKANARRSSLVVKEIPDSQTHLRSGNRKLDDDDDEDYLLAARNALRSLATTSTITNSDCLYFLNNAECTYDIAFES